MAYFHCMAGSLLHGSAVMIVNLYEFDENRRKTVSRYQLEKSEDCRTEKNEKIRNLPNLMTTFESRMRKFLYHYFINKQQTVVYNSGKHLAISELSKAAMVSMDFSEKFHLYTKMKIKVHTGKQVGGSF